MHISFTNTSIASITDFIITTYHKNLRENLDNIISETKALSEQYSQLSELHQVYELLKQFKSEISPHIDREESDFFPVLREIEQTALGTRQFNDCDLEKFEATIRRLELEHEHFDTYVYDFVKIFTGSTLKQENEYVYDYFLYTYEKMQSETKRHTELENRELHPLAKDLFLQVCHLKRT
jgi:iron-sulfur cluster repair protein YtfE (RIC family)